MRLCARFPLVYCAIAGQPDPNGPANINDAWNGGMSYVDGYIFPCYSCTLTCNILPVALVTFSVQRS